jgi:ABC-type Fe3+ transport system substrate-binding protein
VIQPAPLKLAKNPPHPNAARLLTNFMLSDQAAEILAKENRPPGPSDLMGLTRF